MELEGKCLEEFIMYYTELDNNVYQIKGFGKILYPSFSELPMSLQYGVLVYFFDSVEIDVGVLGTTSFVCDNEADEAWQPQHQISKHEARREAIKKACEIFNNRA